MPRMHYKSTHVRRQHTPHTHLESSTRASGRGTAPSLIASNQTRGSRFGTTTKGFMSLLATSFCVSSKLPTAPWPSSVAIPVADSPRTAAPFSPLALAHRTAAARCVDGASPAPRRNPAAAAPAPPAGPLTRNAAVGLSVSRPAAATSTADSFRDSEPPAQFCCCPFRRPMVAAVSIFCWEKHQIGVYVCVVGMWQIFTIDLRSPKKIAWSCGTTKIHGVHRELIYVLLQSLRILNSVSLCRGNIAGK